jgi:peptidoglycan/xylan/chitin deacetylase (PgdA/CDA1 family)
MRNREITRKSLFALSLAGLMFIADAAFAWPKGSISALPKSSTRRVAWTVDDGASSSALGRYVTMLEKNPSVKITFFVLSGAPGWSKYATRLKALQDSGQIQLANHTRTHRVLTKLSDAKIKEELNRCEAFCLAKYGKSTKPYFRPPYGEIDARVIRVAASIGFTKPMLWYGSFAAGSGVASSTVLKSASKWIANGRIVIDHANGYCTTNIFPQILNIFRSRKLKLVTLHDAFGTTPQ